MGTAAAALAAVPIDGAAAAAATPLSTPAPAPVHAPAPVLAPAPAFAPDPVLASASAPVTTPRPAAAALPAPAPEAVPTPVPRPSVTVATAAAARLATRLDTWRKNRGGSVPNARTSIRQLASRASARPTTSSSRSAAMAVCWLTRSSTAAAAASSGKRATSAGEGGANGRGKGGGAGGRAGGWELPALPCALAGGASTSYTASASGTRRGARPAEMRPPPDSAVAAPYAKGGATWLLRALPSTLRRASGYGEAPTDGGVATAAAAVPRWPP